MFDPKEDLQDALADFGDMRSNQEPKEGISVEGSSFTESAEELINDSEETVEHNEETPNDYEVGFGRPPKHGQFKPGMSGNPSGRPKGSKNFLTRFNEVTSSLVTVTENGRTKTMPLIEAIIHKEAHRALSNTRAAHQIFKMEMLFETIEQPKTEKVVRHEGERKAIRNLLARIQKIKLSDPSDSE